MLLALSREVRRAPRHVSVLMIHQLVHRRQVNPQHHEAADKDIPPGMSREVLAPGAPDSPLKDGPKRSAGCPFAVAEEPLCSRSVYSNYPESRRQDFIHRHTSRWAGPSYVFSWSMLVAVAAAYPERSARGRVGQSWGRDCNGSGGRQSIDRGEDFLGFRKTKRLQFREDPLPIHRHLKGAAVPFE